MYYVSTLCSRKTTIKNSSLDKNAKRSRKLLGSNKPASDSKRWFQEWPERISLLIQILKVDLIDPKPFGFDSNEISTETENFTVLGVGV